MGIRMINAPESEAAMGEVKLADPISLRIDLAFAPEPREPAKASLPGGQSTAVNAFLKVPLSTPDAPDPEPLHLRLGGHVRVAPVDPIAEAAAVGLTLGPAEAPTALDEFVEAAYLLGGWKRIENYRWQLQWMRRAIDNPSHCAGLLLEGDPPREQVEAMAGKLEATRLLPLWVIRRDDLPPMEWEVESAMRLTKHLAQGAPATTDCAPNPARVRAAVKRAAALDQAIEAKSNALRPRLLAELRRVELAAQRQALLQLTASRQQILSEGWRLLGMIDGMTFEEWHPRTAARLLYTPPTAAAAELNAILTSLAAAANDVMEADFAITWEIFTSAAKKLPEAGIKSFALGPGLGPQIAAAEWIRELYLIPRSKKVEKLRTKLADAQTVLARQLAPAAARYPILLRYTPLAILLAANEEPGRFTFGLCRRFIQAFEAADKMLKLFTREQPLASASAAPNGAPEDAWAAEFDGSVWAYRKAIVAGADALYLTPGSLGHAAVREMLAAVDHAREAKESVRTAVATIQTSLAIALGFVCPPAGIALDAAFGIADAIMEHDIYQTRTAEYFCALDPADSFADVEPSMLPLVMAVAGVVAAPL
jgi:hypothetical protein